MRSGDGRVVLQAWEAKGKKRAPVIYLTQGVWAILAPLVEARPADPVFRNTDGNPWTRFAVNCASCRSWPNTWSRVPTFHRKSCAGSFDTPFRAPTIISGISFAQFTATCWRSPRVPRFG